MPRILAALTMTLLGAAGVQAQSVAWNIDQNHTTVGFTARHLGFSRVHGQFKTFSAKVQADAKTGKLVSIEATIAATSVDTGVEKRDNHLRSDDFFATAEHPQITVKSKSIKWKGNKFTGVAALTIRGHTKDVPFEGELLGVETLNFGQGAHLRAGLRGDGQDQSQGLSPPAIIERMPSSARWTRGFLAIG